MGDLGEFVPGDAVILRDRQERLRHISRPIEALFRLLRTGG
jgi:hypothetical protein